MIELSPDVCYVGGVSKAWRDSCLLKVGKAHKALSENDNESSSLLDSGRNLRWRALRLIRCWRAIHDDSPGQRGCFPSYYPGATDCRPGDAGSAQGDTIAD